MYCYQHENQAAQGICKSCYKALCKQCAVEIEMAITCKGKCEEYSTMTYQMVLANSQMIGGLRKRSKWAYHFIFEGGLLLAIGLGFMAYKTGNVFDSVLMVSALFISLYGYSTLQSIKRLSQPERWCDVTNQADRSSLFPNQRM